MRRSCTSEETSRRRPRRDVYRTCRPRMWVEGPFAELSDDGKLLYLYLLLGDLSTILPGVVEAGPGAVMDRLGWDSERFAKPFAELLSKRLLQSDAKRLVMFLPEAPADDLPANQNQVTGWGRFFSDLPQCDTKVHIYETFKLLLKPLGKQFAERFDQEFLQPLPKPATQQPSNPTTQQDGVVGTAGVDRALLAVAVAEGGEPERGEGEKLRNGPEGDRGQSGGDPAPAAEPIGVEERGEAESESSSEGGTDNDDEGYPWSSQDEARYGDRTRPHPAWEVYVQTHTEAKTPAPWPSFAAWLASPVPVEPRTGRPMCPICRRRPHVSADVRCGPCKISGRAADAAALQAFEATVVALRKAAKGTAEEARDASQG